VRKWGVRRELINAPEAEGQLPIWIACVNGFIEGLKTLLDLGADVDVDVREEPFLIGPLGREAAR
jgi:hypothetical protein